MPKFISSIFLLFLASASCKAADIRGVRFPNRVSVKGKVLRLNGVGLLQKSIFHVDVYVAGLYLQKRANQPERILASRQMKNVTLVFLRDIPSRQLADSWKEGFEHACGRYCGETRTSLHRFVSALPDVHRGQKVRFVFLRDRVWVESRGHREVFHGAQFSRIFLATFIGKETSDKDVREGLLSGRAI